MAIAFLSNWPRRIVAAGLLSLGACALAQTAAPKLPDAAASDPVTMGWMVGFPPPPDRVIRFADGSATASRSCAGRSRTTAAWCRPATSRAGWRAPVPLPRAERDDIDARQLPRAGQRPAHDLGAVAAAPTTPTASSCCTRGAIVYERYFGALRPEGQHIAMSVTKSFFGTIGAMLVADGTLDANAPASKYVPELKDSAFGDATVRQLLDMTTGLQYSENYADPKAEVWEPRARRQRAAAAAGLRRAEHLLRVPASR